MATSRATLGREVFQFLNTGAGKCKGRGVEGCSHSRTSGSEHKYAHRPSKLASVSSLRHELFSPHKIRAKRLPKSAVSAKWGKKQEPPAESASAPPVEAPPPDARNLGRLSKVLPFSVYELQALKFPRDLKEGDYGADVEVLQRALHTFGHMPKDSQITG